MRTPPARVIVSFTAGLGALIVILAVTGSRPPVSLTIRGFTTNSWRTDKSDGSCRYVLSAIIEFTNASDCPVSYLGNRDPSFPDYTLLCPTPTGWKSPTPRAIDELGWQPFALASSQAIAFEVEVDEAKPCMIALNYWNDRILSSQRQRLPQWIAGRLPCMTTFRTVTTGKIDLASTKP